MTLAAQRRIMSLMADANDPRSDDVLAGVAAADGPAGRAAFAALYDRHAGRLRAYLAARLRREPDDATQAAFLKALAGLRAGRYQGGNFRAWLFRLAVNAALDAASKKRPAEAAEGFDPPAPLPPPEPSERCEILARCFEALRRQKPEWAAVVTHVAGGGDRAAYAAGLGVGRNAVDKQFSRAAEALRHCVEKGAA